MAEQRFRKPQVKGSTPFTGSSIIIPFPSGLFMYAFGLLPKMIFQNGALALLPRNCLLGILSLIVLGMGCSVPSEPTPQQTGATVQPSLQEPAGTTVVNPDSDAQTPAAVKSGPNGAEGKSEAGIEVQESPTARPEPTPLPTVQPIRLSAEDLPPAPDRDLFKLARELLLPPDHPEIPRVVNSEPVSYEAGRQDVFYLVDLDGLEKYQSTFELRHVSPHAYWYVEEGLRVEQEDIERSAREFEDNIYPRVTDYFGTEWVPGVDNDPHLTIVHGDIRGAGGYFSSTDEYPTAVRPHSNQREMIYINARYLRVGSEIYYNVLAHELNHAIHWNHDPSEDTWVSEGLAELSVSVAGYAPDSIGRYLQRPYVSLVHWPLDDANIGAHYGGASLFLHYLYEHYSGADRESLRNLLSQAEDNVSGVEAYLDAHGYDKDFHEVLGDWLAANFLDEPDGLLGYRDLQVEVQASRRISNPDRIERKLDQYGTHYIELGSRLREAPALIRFEGKADNQLLPTDVPLPGCWWSNSGDSITSTLAREVDLTGVEEARLGYDVWFSIEEEWDYVYLQVSTDGGQTWDILNTPHTSDANPIGVAFGPGYTGSSREWRSESVDLSEYAGKKVHVRFQYVTDDALNDIGLCLRDLSLPGASIEPGDGGWKAEGFVHIDNRVPQHFMVQVIQKGLSNRVLQMPLGLSTSGVWTGELLIEPYEGLERTMIAVTAVAPVTRVKAEYLLDIREADQASN